MHIFTMKKTGVKPTSINRNKIVYFKPILSLVKADSNKIGFSKPVPCKEHWRSRDFQVSKTRYELNSAPETR